jgi:glyoxylase I family protein
VTDLVGVHHLGLTVTDVERSARWYADVLGFHELGRLGTPGDERRKVFLRHDGISVRVGLVEHARGCDVSFDETRPGLDHLSFAVPDRSALERWCRRLDKHGVTYTPVADARSIPDAVVVVFRDPDNIQLELFVDPA